jgi:NAD(P)-dependent dehydrogenase (short-subunit alcohol dehydrogenase family)
MQPDIDQPKSVLITGCSSGIGRAVAIVLANHAYTVFATVRKETDREKLLALNLPNLIPICPLDLTCTEQIGAAIETVRAELARRGQPGLYALINNAGAGQVAPVELLDTNLFQRELQTRLSGAVALVQAALPLLRAGQGRILWIMTPAAIPTPFVTSIHACDFAVNCLVRTLGIELQPWHIPLVQIRCGGIATSTGRQTTDGVEQILRHPRGELYRARLTRWSAQMAAFDTQRTAPEKVGELVCRVLDAPRPRSRYAIGHMAGLAALLEALPQPWADAILRRRF